MDLKSNEPFWLVKNGLVHSYPSLRQDLKTEILIIGGGITGSLIAHQCIKDGYQVTLIDRREIANGSSSATTSMLQYEIDTPLHKLIEMVGEIGAVASYQGCFDAIDKIGKISKLVKSKSGFKKQDSLYFAARKKDVTMLKRELEARKKHGFPVQWLEADEIKKRFQLDAKYGGILTTQGGSIDAFRLTHDILKYNQEKGLQIFDKTEIKSINYNKNNVEIKTDYSYTIKAQKLLFCNGFEATEIIKEKFVDLLSSYAIVGEVNKEDQSYLNDTLFWDTGEPYLYMRTTDDNRLLIGGEDEDFVDDEKRDKLLQKKANTLTRKLKNLFPKYTFYKDFAWAGTFGETKDGLPYIGAHPDFPGAYFILGFGGNGITFSVIGMEMVSAMLKGEKHELDDYFRFGR